MKEVDESYHAPLRRSSRLRGAPFCMKDYIVQLKIVQIEDRKLSRDYSVEIPTLENPWFSQPRKPMKLSRDYSVGIPTLENPWFSQPRKPMLLEQHSQIRCCSRAPSRLYIMRGQLPMGNHTHVPKSASKMEHGDVIKKLCIRKKVTCKYCGELR